MYESHHTYIQILEISSYKIIPFYDIVINTVEYYGGLIMLKSLKLFLCLIVLFTVMVGCSSKRDVSSLEAALIGHWRTVPDKEIENSIPTDYYFSKDKLIMIDHGTKSNLEYEITQTNDSENWIKVKLKGSDNSGHIKTLTFNDEERTSALESFSLSDMNVSSDDLTNEKAAETLDLLQSALGSSFSLDTEWTYIDNKTKP